jgi:uncharacterized protein YcnI
MKNLFKFLAFLSISTTLLFSSVSTFAHVVVKPDIAKPASYQTFTVNVPNEKDIPTIKLRLVLPEGVDSVSVTNKIGWTANIVKEGEKAKEIEWSGGTIPKDFRDEFSFSAKTPAKEDEIAWKAYQTYQDGTVVSWDQMPHNDHGDEKKDSTEKTFPYSKTTLETSNSGELHSTPNISNILIWVVSLVALGLSISTYMKKPVVK